jgi:chromosome segregation ATPase
MKVRREQSIQSSALIAVIIITAIMITPAFAQFPIPKDQWDKLSKAEQDKIDIRLKKNCEQAQKLAPSSIPKYCSKYGIESQQQLPTDPIEFQKQQLTNKINELTKKFNQDVVPKRSQIGEQEYMKQYNEMQKQIESLELKLTALESGRSSTPQEEIQNTCETGKVPDAFGNCVTAKQKKIMQMKNAKGVPADLIDDNENLKAENAELKSRVDALEKKVSSLESLIKQLQTAIAKITG